MERFRVFLGNVLRFLKGERMYIHNAELYDPEMKQGIMVNLRKLRTDRAPLSVGAYITQLIKQEAVKPSKDITDYIINHRQNIWDVPWESEECLTMMYESMMFSDKSSYFIPQGVLHGVSYKNEQGKDNQSN